MAERVPMDGPCERVGRVIALEVEGFAPWVRVRLAVTGRETGPSGVSFDLEPWDAAHLAALLREQVRNYGQQLLAATGEEQQS